MTGPLLIMLGVLALATIFSFVFANTDNDREYSEERSNQQVRRELAAIHQHRPHHIIDHEENEDQ